MFLYWVYLYSSHQKGLWRIHDMASARGPTQFTANFSEHYTAHTRST